MAKENTEIIQGITIKYGCKKCGHIEPDTYTETIIKLLIGMLIIFGMFFIGLIIYLGPTNFSMNVASAEFNMYALENVDEIRSIALEHTTYDGDDSFEFAADLMENLPRIRYVPHIEERGLFTPKIVYEQGGDCKNSATMFVAMMLSLGVDAYVECNAEYLHCVSIIPHKTSSYVGDRYMVVDLTVDVTATYYKNISHWENKYDYIEMVIYDRENEAKTVSTIRRN